MSDITFHTLMDGDDYLVLATSPRWIAGYNVAGDPEDEDVTHPVGLMVETGDDCDMREDPDEDHPIRVEVSIVPLVIGPQRRKHATDSGGDVGDDDQGPEGIVEASYRYGGGVPVTHVMLDGIDDGRPVDPTAFGGVWKAERADFGTVAAQRGPGIFQCPTFADDDGALAFARDLIERKGDAVCGVMVGFILDRPVNLAGDSGWSVLTEAGQ